MPSPEVSVVPQQAGKKKGPPAPGLDSGDYVHVPYRETPAQLVFYSTEDGVVGVMRVADLDAPSPDAAVTLQALPPDQP